MKVLASLKYKYRTYKSEYKEFGLKWWLKSVKHDIVYPFKRFYRFVIKLFKYGKLLWSDFEFDWIYLLKVLRLKMQLMAENFDKNGITVSAPQKAKELRLCIALIDRIISNEYDTLAHEQLERKYGKLIWDDKPIEIGGKRYYEVNIYRERAPKGTPAYEEERKASSKAFADAERQRKQDIAYLFETMRKRLEGWWD